MTTHDEEDTLLRSVAIQNAGSILLARQRAEEELLRSQEALHENRQRLQAALSAAGAGTYRWDIQTSALDWDEHLARMFGLAPGQHIRHLDDFIATVHPEDRAGVIEHCRRCADTGADFDMEFRVVWPDGSVHWIEDKGKTSVDAADRPVHMTGACTDITRRKEEEEELWQRSEQLRTTFNQAAVGIALAGLDGRFLDLNQKFSEILGYTAAELRQMTFRDITHPADLSMTDEQVQRLRAGEVPDYVLEKRYLRKDGTIVWSRTTVTLLRNAAGRPERYIGVIEDITQRKRTEDALTEETRILELLNDTGTAIASKLDLQSLVQTVTDAATTLTGARFGAFFYTVIDAAGESFLLYTLSGAPREAFEKFGLPRNTPVFHPTFHGEGVVRSADITRDPRYGTIAPHHGMPAGHLPVRSYLAVPVRSRSGEVLGGLFFGHPDAGVFSERAERLALGVASQAAIAIDNARLYEAAQQASAERAALLESERAARSNAERSSALKDDFLATLSHELRTPLNAILGWAHILRHSGADPAAFRKAVDTIERNARAQTALIEDLLDMSRIASGKVRLELKTLQPVSCVEAAVETVQPFADAKGITLNRRLDPSAGPVAGDANRLQQVVWNVLSNAIKFTPAGGTVDVGLRRDGAHVEITVRDTGIGIEEGFINHVFERFRQADSSTTRTHGGLGLGLAIVQHIVELHGGTVALTSPGEGFGTTVTVLLPLLEEPRTQPPGGAV